MERQRFETNIKKIKVTTYSKDSQVKGSDCEVLTYY